MNDVKFSSVVELSRALQAKEVSAVELAKAYLERIEAHKDLNCFLDVRPEVTLAQAQAADKRIAEGKAGRLTGIPIAHKDIFVTRDWASTAASKMLKGYMSPFDAAVVRKLAESGMVTSANSTAMNSQWALPTKILPTVRFSTPGIQRLCRAAVPAVQQAAWLRALLRLPRQPTRAAPSVNLRPLPALPA